MIILDTNVISELTRLAPDPGVISWLDLLPAEETAITAITVAELLYGVRRLPDGRRKIELSEAVHALIDADFRNRIEPFDVLAADQYADVSPGGNVPVSRLAPPMCRSRLSAGSARPRSRPAIRPISRARALI